MKNLDNRTKPGYNMISAGKNRQNYKVILNTLWDLSPTTNDYKNLDNRTKPGYNRIRG